MSRADPVNRTRSGIEKISFLEGVYLGIEVVTLVEDVEGCLKENCTYPDLLSHQLKEQRRADMETCRKFCNMGSGQILGPIYDLGNKRLRPYFFLQIRIGQLVLCNNDSQG